MPLAMLGFMAPYIVFKVRHDNLQVYSLRLGESKRIFMKSSNSLLLLVNLFDSKRDLEILVNVKNRNRIY